MTLSLDPEIAEALRPFLPPEPPPPLPVGDVGTRRAVFEPMLAAVDRLQPEPDDVTTTDVVVESSDGAGVRARWYARNGAAPGSAVVYAHGGGMILGDIDVFSGTVARYVSATGVPFLSVDYRRAPEHPHPTPVEDVYAALSWLHANAASLGVDPRRIAVMGDSGGGGLAAAASLLARDRGGPAIARQILLFPMLDDRTTVPDPELVPFMSWSYEDNATGWQALLGAAAGTDAVPAHAAPARVEDTTGLPAAYIEVGQLDIFRDEDLTYAVRLSRGGVPVELHLHPGAPHEFDGIAVHADVTRRARADRIRVLSSI
jgi:acetyl esterase/lipase